MTEKDAVTLRTKLDAAIAADTTGNAIIFGETAFLVFLHKGWIVWRTMTGILPPNIVFDEPSYADRSAICDPRVQHNDANIK